ncbi:MAG: MiaB/RimO family radical SAM methylthiotransferase [Anaerolineae bacterium]|nr:MiaB/RimO family radical SAM methylthiotransferase [Phycisphaerae bacterium]
MKTFLIQTLGCKVNQYESEQIATLLRSRGLLQTDSPELADLRIVNSCSVTMEAASKSRQSTRRLIRLPVLPEATIGEAKGAHSIGSDEAHAKSRGRIIVTGCWATSNREEASSLAGVDAVLTHMDDVAGELTRLLAQWQAEDTIVDPQNQLPVALQPATHSPAQGSIRDEGIMNLRAGTPGPELPSDSKPHGRVFVKKNNRFGATSLPLLDDRHTGHQRAFLKIQDGCDAHCTYCIIPNLRPALWSKPIDDAVEEASRLVEAGHQEIVLTGIFLGAFGQPTALRRRQPADTQCELGKLIDALCTRVPGLRRLRLSSLEPGDLSEALIATLKSHPQIVPHFHLPLQSGSDALLRRMNRQYSGDDFLRMIDQVNQAFDRPAITTDIIVGFPGETDEEFDQTLEVVGRAKFIHIHAFPFSPRPGTAAARWSNDFVDPRTVKNRIQILTARAASCDFAFRSQFICAEVEILVERNADESSPMHHGRCERYFDVHVEDPTLQTGDAVRVRIDRITPSRTFGVRCA